MKINELVNIVRQTGFETHVYFKSGFLEKVYENALVHRLRKKGLSVNQQYALQVSDEDGTIVGEYIADLLVNDQLIIELKAIKNIEEIHIAQLLAYLKSTNLKHGMLMNFGSSTFQVKKYIL